ncbi:AGC kinase, putative [Eimeria mitis]|uniref:AGC kinase, putative n=1 Tax=Eimeria mitis TaxID=44415 RepID=U6K7I3_9EIME|nr:AGC kinase, putative [Eimeria mitis]CDJ33899.1 AGC kinase, putative [Eimeria mitis]
MINHPFTVNMVGTFLDDYYLYIVMEYVIGGEFFTLLRKLRRFDNEAAKFYAAQVTCIFEYLHGRNIIYRDLKPENLLVDSEGYLKLTDFGFAKVIEHRTYTLCGTPEYIAPEVLLNKGHGKPVDWWTMGILIYEMIVGYPPFFDDEPMGVYQKILGGRIVFPKSFDRNAKMLVKRLLTPDLAKRQQICFDCVAETLEKHLPPTRKLSFIEEVLLALQQLPMNTSSRVSHYLLHSTTFVESTDPELWGRLVAALPAALKTAAPEAELILCSFSSLLQPGGGCSASAAVSLVSCCLQRVAAALRLLPPTHPLLHLLLQLVFDCLRLPLLSSDCLAHDSNKLLRQLGETFQAVFASEAAKPQVQRLALQLLQQLFTIYEESCKEIFIEDICIVDWLLEAARNGKAVAEDAVHCLQQHIFNSPAFLQHHLDTTKQLRLRAFASMILLRA